MDRTAIKIKKLKEKDSDFDYWQTQPYEARLSALQKIREEYIQWKYGHRQRFQRVYSIVKQK